MKLSTLRDPTEAKFKNIAEANGQKLWVNAGAARLERTPSVS